MGSINIVNIFDYAKRNIEVFHKSRLKSLKDTRLNDLLRRKNPYLFRAKNILTAEQLIRSFLDAKLSSSEEKIFGDFLEELAIHIAEKSLNAVKSGLRGIDFEFTKKDARYLVSVKSGLQWGNSSQWKALESDFKTANKVLRQSSHIHNVVNILGICYGKAKTTLKRGIMLQICGQNFWYLISGDESFYIEIVKPLAYKAKELNDAFETKKAEIINIFTKQFIDEFCDKNGKILWSKLIKYNSGNITAQDKEKLKK